MITPSPKIVAFKSLALSSFVLCSISLRADFKVAAPFTDHMFLQLSMKVPVWGNA